MFLELSQFTGAVLAIDPTLRPQEHSIVPNLFVTSEKTWPSIHPYIRNSRRKILYVFTPDDSTPDDITGWTQDPTFSHSAAFSLLMKTSGGQQVKSVQSI